MKGTMFGINLIITIISAIMMVIFTLGHILGSETEMDKFNYFLVSMLICVYSGFNAKAILED